MLPSCLSLVSPWGGSTPTLSCDLSFKAPNSWFVFPSSFSRSNGNWREIMLWPRNTPCALETQWCDHLLRLAVRGVCLETHWRDTLLRLAVQGVFLVHIAGTKGAPWTGRAQEWRHREWVRWTSLDSKDGWLRGQEDECVVLLSMTS